MMISQKPQDLGGWKRKTTPYRTRAFGGAAFCEADNSPLMISQEAATQARMAQHKSSIDKARWCRESGDVPNIRLRFRDPPQRRKSGFLRRHHDS
ncbi:MAG: hypothetical protein M0017_04835, partial [Desulfobacteraceae bacterium]|nr:hypothetical protein [Desulfobacteraceae bacterium]